MMLGSTCRCRVPGVRHFVTMEPTRVRLAISGHVLEIDGSMDPPGVRVFVRGAPEQSNFWPAQPGDVWFQAKEAEGEPSWTLLYGVSGAGNRGTPATTVRP